MSDPVVVVIPTPQTIVVSTTRPAANAVAVPTIVLPDQVDGGIY